MLKIARFLLLTSLLAGCGGVPGRPPIPSPDGSMMLHTRIEQSRVDPRAYLCVVFEIRDGSGRVLHAENTRASDRMRWNMSWVSDDRIRLESSDIGTYYWRKQADGGWVKEQAEKPPSGGHFLTRHGHVLRECGIPDEIAANTRRFLIFLDHGYSQWGGPNTAMRSSTHVS